MEFEWDARKAATNLAKHGVSFEEATAAFADDRRVIAYDVRHSTHDEPRWFCFGQVAGHVLTVRFAIRDERIRIYGAGYWREGRRRYGEAHSEGL